MVVCAVALVLVILVAVLSGLLFWCWRRYYKTSRTPPTGISGTQLTRSQPLDIELHAMVAVAQAIPVAIAVPMLELSGPSGTMKPQAGQRNFEEQKRDEGAAIT